MHLDGLGRRSLINTNADFFSAMVIDAAQAVKITDSKGNPMYPNMAMLLKAQANRLAKV